jgi:hypothetical protein
MYIVNASKFIKLDAKKLSKMGSDSVDQSNDASLSSTPDGPATILIKNMRKEDPDGEGVPRGVVIDFITQHPEHFFLLEESDSDLLREENGQALPSNLYLGHAARVNNETQKIQSDDTFRWLVIENPEDFDDFDELEKYNWVIINISNAEKINLKNISIALLVKHCNNRSIPVSVYPTDTDLGPLDAALRESDGGQHDPLYFELPITDNHTLMMIAGGMSQKVSKANVDLQHWVVEFDVATMFMAYYLFKLILMARHSGQKSFWSHYFGVKTVEEFTKTFIEISRSQMYRYIQSIEVIELLYPGMMEGVISQEVVIPRKVLSYSRWLVVYPFRYDIESNPNGIKDKIKRMLLDPGVTAHALRALLNSEFPQKSLAKRPEPFSIINAIKEFNMSLMSQMVEEKRILLFKHLKAILWVYISDLPRDESNKNADVEIEEWGKSLEATLKIELGIAS